MNQFSRTELLLGAQGMEKLASSRVAVFGIGGVGSFTAEALARSGIGALDLVDDDTVCMTNLNRQLLATRSSVGKVKVEVMRDRLRDINPDLSIKAHRTFFDAEHAHLFDFSAYDYVVDAIDTVSAKLALVECAQAAGVPVISCMGAGNKLDPTRFEVADIYKTSVCPLAKVMRHELRKRGIKNLKVVYSREEAMTPLATPDNDCKSGCICPPDATRNCTVRRQVPGSVAFVPSVAGLILAGEVVCDLTGVRNK